MSNGSQIAYAAHVQDIGWQVPVWSDAIAGTTGQSKRIEALALMITGDNYIIASAHVQNLGWQNEVTGASGNFIVVGTTGKSLRMEALRITLGAGGICGNAYIQNSGWQHPANICASGGTFPLELGTTGSSLRMEAIRLTMGT
jgi:uncharacterized protein YjdB